MRFNFAKESMPLPVEEPDTKTELEQEPPWSVIVLNDPVNLMSYVVMVFRKVFGYDLERAKKHMMEVHQTGRSVLWVGEFEKAEAYVYTLQSWKWTATLEQVD
jgi:ATP-dependent Clp protease adaptor protein ClpS